MPTGGLTGCRELNLARKSLCWEKYQYDIKFRKIPNLNEPIFSSSLPAHSRCDKCFANVCLILSWSSFCHTLGIYLVCALNIAAWTQFWSVQTHQVYFRSIIFAARSFILKFDQIFSAVFVFDFLQSSPALCNFMQLPWRKKKKSSTILTLFHATLSRGQLLTHFWKALLVSLVLSGCNQQPCWSQIAFFLHPVSDCSSSSHLTGLKFWLCLVLK